jgi:hypothetical protein
MRKGGRLLPAICSTSTNDDPAGKAGFVNATLVLQETQSND